MAKLKRQAPRLQRAADRLKSGDSWRTNKPTAAARLYGREWQAARLEHLQANPLCKRCQELGRISAATVVDHIEPHNGDPVLFWDRTNWQSMCGPCHNGWKQAQEHAQKYSAGRSV